MTDIIDRMVEELNNRLGKDGLSFKRVSEPDETTDGEVEICLKGAKTGHGISFGPYALTLTRWTDNGEAMQWLVETDWKRGKSGRLQSMSEFVDEASELLSRHLKQGLIAEAPPEEPLTVPAPVRKPQLPEGYVVKPVPDRPKALVGHEPTGREMKVPLYALHEVRVAIEALHPGFSHDSLPDPGDGNLPSGFSFVFEGEDSDFPSGIRHDASGAEYTRGYLLAWSEVVKAVRALVAGVPVPSLAERHGLAQEFERNGVEFTLAEYEVNDDLPGYRFSVDDGDSPCWVVKFPKGEWVVIDVAKQSEEKLPRVERAEFDTLEDAADYASEAVPRSSLRM